MEEREAQFLLAEYNHCWMLINAIDERRGKFLQSITTVVIAAIGAVGFLITEKGPLPLSRTLEASALLVLTLVGVLAVFSILRAERGANVKRRKWVNLIRSILLAGTKDQSIKDYLLKDENKELGIKLPEDDEPNDVGATLRGMFWFLAVELLALVVSLAYVWARHFGHIQA
jgi:hypothetical protein